MDFESLLKDKILELEEQREIISESLNETIDNGLVSYDREDIKKMNFMLEIYEDLLEEIGGE